MEIVGGIASITQLTHYALSLIATISDIYRDLQKRPALQRQQLDQLQRLYTTVQTIHSSSALSSSSIQNHLKIIILRIQDLKARLERLVAQQPQRPIKKYFKAFINHNKAKYSLVDVFVELERDKSALLLSISEIQTGLSAKTHDELIARLPRMQATPTGKPYQSHRRTKEKKTSDVEAVTSLPEDHTVAPKRHQELASFPDPETVETLSELEDDEESDEEWASNEASPEASTQVAIEAEATHIKYAKTMTSKMTSKPKDGKSPSGVEQSSHKLFGTLYEDFKFAEGSRFVIGEIGERKGKVKEGQGSHYKKFRMGKNSSAVKGKVFVDAENFMKDFWGPKPL